MKPKAVKQREAKERQDYWDSLSTKQKLEDLDRRLGKNQGSSKQRKKLLENM